MNWWMIIATALLSSLFTCVLAFVWFRFRTRPSLMRQLDEEFRHRLEEASQVIGDKVEESVSQGMVEGVTALASREVVEGTTRNLARTSAEIVEDRVNRLFGRSRGTRRRDHGPDER